MVSKRTWSSHLPTNTPKIHLHMEQSSLKTNWKLAGLLYNQGCKKNTYVLGQEGKNSDQVGTCASGIELRDKGRLHGQRSLLGSEQFERHIGHPNPGVQYRKHEPPWLAGRLLSLTEGLLEDWAHSGGVRVPLLAPEAGWRGCNETLKVIDWFSTSALVCVSARAK